MDNSQIFCTKCGEVRDAQAAVLSGKKPKALNQCTSCDSFKLIGLTYELVAEIEGLYGKDQLKAVVQNFDHYHADMNSHFEKRQDLLKKGLLKHVTISEGSTKIIPIWGITTSHRNTKWSP